MPTPVAFTPLVAGSMLMTPEVALYAPLAPGAMEIFTLEDLTQLRGIEKFCAGEELPTPVKTVRLMSPNGTLIAVLVTAHAGVIREEITMLLVLLSNIGDVMVAPELF